LRNAALAITDGDGPMEERLRSAYLYNLSGLQEEDFLDAEGLAAYMDIRAALSKFSEAMERGPSGAPQLPQEPANAPGLIHEPVRLLPS
jgi:hypothetical protein